MSQRLIILGASARAAAMSAVRAGFEPWTADLFADADLRALVPAAVRCPVGDYPRGFREILRGAPEVPWLYTGGLENHPNLIRDLSEIRPLWGNGPNALTACRSPFRVEPWQCRLLRLLHLLLWPALGPLGYRSPGVPRVRRPRLQLWPAVQCSLRSAWPPTAALCWAASSR